MHWLSVTFQHAGLMLWAVVVGPKQASIAKPSINLESQRKQTSNLTPSTSFWSWRGSFCSCVKELKSKVTWWYLGWCQHLAKLQYLTWDLTALQSVQSKLTSFPQTSASVLVVCSVMLGWIVLGNFLFFFFTFLFFFHSTWHRRKFLYT